MFDMGKNNSPNEIMMVLGLELGMCTCKVNNMSDLIIFGKPTIYKNNNSKRLTSSFFSQYYLLSRKCR